MNRHALLDSLQYFSVASSALLPDIMHDVLEGALPYEIKLMLKVHINYLIPKLKINFNVKVVPKG